MNENLETCLQCGREMRPHCPLSTCGSYRKRAFASQRDVVTRDDGSKELLTVYRCETCGCRYNDDDWRYNCQAPPVRGNSPNSWRAKAERRRDVRSVGAKPLSEDPDVLKYALEEAVKNLEERRSKPDYSYKPYDPEGLFKDDDEEEKK